MKRLTWLLLVLTLVSCVPTGNVMPTVISSTPSFTPEAIVATFSATPTSTFTLTPLPFQLVFPAKTFSPKESDVALLELLKTNGNCTGKCIAGIRPDEMTVQEAVDTMSRWGTVRIGENSQGKTFINLVQHPLYERIFVKLSVGTWTSKLKTIDRVTFYIGGAPGYGLIGEENWSLYDKDLMGFRLDTLLKTYGVPSYVGYFFQTTVEIGKPLEGRTISYSLEIQYEKMNLVVGMGAMSFYDGENLILCPSVDPHDLGIVINPERPLKERRDFFPITWQALTSTDLDAFYQMFTDETDPNACITTNLEQIQTLQPSFR